MSELLVQAFSIMGVGMAGIFVATAVIIVFVWALQKMDSMGQKKDKENK